MDEHAKRCLHRYVHEHEKPDVCIRTLLPIILQQPKRAITVYRGQDNTPTINRLGIRGFLSTSKRKEVAREEFSKGGCCVFTIHVEADVPSLDVCQFIPKGSKGDEDEILLPEGGYFYRDGSLKTEGFAQLKAGEYDTWYTMKAPPAPPAEMTVERALSIIHPDEYELIDTPEDIDVGVPISLELRRAIFQEIQRKKAL